MCGGWFKNRAIYAGAVTGALAISIFDALTAAGLPIESVNNLIAEIPFASAGFPWIIPAILGAAVGGALARAGYGSAIEAPAELAVEVRD
jgi:LIVCS family branched-chain amino acid:cation transporter